MPSYLISHLEPDFASMIDAHSVEQGIGLSCGKAAEQDSLPMLLCMT